jgi:anthranilate phosphoribosyltransferase
VADHDGGFAPKPPLTAAPAPMAFFPLVFEEIASSSGPRPATLRAAFDAIFAGAWTPVQIAGFAVALRLRGEGADTIAAAAEAMRAVMIPVDHGLPRVVDTCGTGGDGLGTINLSTAAAIVVASVGLPVAKHGNRSMSSRTGSADVLEALDVPIDVPLAHHAGILRTAGITFLFAPAHHPALRHSGPARRELAVRTIFNALGPVANPARATHQLIGAYEDRLRPILAETLGRLGSRHAWVVRGADGLDEVSPFGPTRVAELAGGRVRERIVSPADFGLEPAPPGALGGGDARANAARILAILAGEADPAASAVVLNAAAAIAVGREATDPAGLRAAAAEAAEALRSGRARRTFEGWRAAARAAISTPPEPA